MTLCTSAFALRGSPPLDVRFCHSNSFECLAWIDLALASSRVEIVRMLCDVCDAVRGCVRLCAWSKMLPLLPAECGVLPGVPKATLSLDLLGACAMHLLIPYHVLVCWWLVHLRTGFSLWRMQSWWIKKARTSEQCPRNPQKYLTTKCCDVPHWWFLRSWRGSQGGENWSLLKPAC